MLCFKNGSLNRERVRESIGCDTWDAFNALLASTEPGNAGSVGLYVAEPEITPPLPRGDYRFDAQGSPVASFEAATEARALVEARKKHICVRRNIFAEIQGSNLHFLL